MIKSPTICLSFNGFPDKEGRICANAGVPEIPGIGNSLRSTKSELWRISSEADLGFLISTGGRRLGMELDRISSVCTAGRLKLVFSI